MDQRLIALRLVLDALEIPPRIETLADRKRIQKAVYLAQSGGIDLGYHFSWYLRGPYSTRLTRDYYELFDHPSPTDVSSMRQRLIPIVQQHLGDFRKLFEVPSEPGNISKEDWLETLASVHFLRGQRSFNNRQAREVIEREKPFLVYLMPFAESRLSGFDLL